jgi:hypothetical protein
MLVCNRCGLTTNGTQEYLSNNYCSNCGALLDPPAEVTNNVLCRVCGGLTRSGQLFGESEITIVMAETNEERFVRAFACIKCGNVQLLVDYETDIVEDE